MWVVLLWGEIGGRGSGIFQLPGQNFRDALHLLLLSQATAGTEDIRPGRFLLVVQLLHLIAGLAGDVDAQTLVELLVLLGDDDGEVGVAAPEAAELLLDHGGQRVGQARDGQGDEYLVGVEPGIPVAQVAGFQAADGLDDELCSAYRNARTGHRSGTPVPYRAYLGRNDAAAYGR